MAVIVQADTSRYYKVQRKKMPLCISIYKGKTSPRIQHYMSVTRIPLYAHPKSVTGKRNRITMSGLQMYMAMWRKMDYYNTILILLQGAKDEK